MSAATESRAETLKLARLLGLEPPDPIAYLQQAPAEELRAYREAVTELLYDDQAELLQRAAQAARLLPAHTLANIGEGALGPLICARITGLLAPERASEIARHFSIEFLAQVAAELDPRRAVDVVASTAPERVLVIAQLMASRGEHVAMGRFVAHLDHETLAGCVAGLSDEDLLRVGFVLDGNERLREIIELVGPERARRMLASADANGLQEEAHHLLDHLDAPQRTQLKRRTRV